MRYIKCFGICCEYTIIIIVSCSYLYQARQPNSTIYWNSTYSSQIEVFSRFPKGSNLTNLIGTDKYRRVTERALNEGSEGVLKIKIKTKKNVGKKGISEVRKRSDSEGGWRDP